MLKVYSSINLIYLFLSGVQVNLPYLYIKSLEQNLVYLAEHGTIQLQACFEKMYTIEVLAINSLLHASSDVPIK